MITRSYIYYRHSGNLSGKVYQYEDLKIEVVNPYAKNLHTLIWRILSFCCFGSYREYLLKRDTKIISRAEVITWIPIFRFMPYSGIHIGPCWTSPEERGKGYYPFLLKRIVRENPSKEYYMMVSDTNISSIHGARKAGFIEVGRGYKNRIGQYVMNKSGLENEK